MAESNDTKDVTDIAWSDASRIVGSGFAMGSADVVPGVSGGTMAVACGIYEELLGAIASINPKSLRALLKLQVAEFLTLVHFRFLICLLLGIGSAVVVMVKIVGLPKLLISHPEEVYAVFFGLVAASVFILGRQIAWNAARGVSLVLGAVVGFLVVTLVPVSTPGGPIFMFLYGAVAISAMLLPGISGSFILLILGQYENVIGAIEDLLHLDFSALLVVVPFGIGCLFGIAAFSRVVAYLLRRHHGPVIAGLSGLLVGSLYRIWPYQQTVTTMVRGKEKVLEATPFLPDAFEVSIALLMVGGFLLVFLVEYVASLRSKKA